MKKIDPLLKWVESEFGFKPVVYSSIFGGKQEDGLVKAVENVLKKTNDNELAAIDALASASHSLVISIAIFRGKLQIPEALELIRLEEDMQVCVFFYLNLADIVYQIKAVKLIFFIWSKWIGRKHFLPLTFQVSLLIVIFLMNSF